MAKNPMQKIVITMIILSLIGLATSIYLVQNHYNPPLGGSGCDFGEVVSCSLVNTSIFSELFGVSVALFGALWFILLLIILYKARKEQKKHALTIFLWHILGLLSVIYLVIAEFILQAICPYCTLVHIIIITQLILSFIILKKLNIPLNIKKMLQQAKPWIITVFLLSLLLIFAFNFSFGEKKNYDNIAKCITEKNVVMYGSFRCGVCAKTREKFGDSFQYIKEIECHPQGENPETERCLEKNIELTPTWIMEVDGQEIKRQVGYMTPE